jgi:phytoene synthase
MPPVSTPQVPDPIQALVRRHDPDRFLTALFAPPDRRDALLTLYAFDHELARAREVTSEPHLALIRLHWWREVLEGARKRHEVATPLAALLDSGQLSPDLLLPVVDAYEIEAEPAIETLAEWRDWLLAAQGGVAVAAARLLSHPNPESFRPLGAALGAARVVRWHAAQAARGRCLLPLDLLLDNGLTREDAMANPVSPGVMTVLGRLVAEGRALLAQGASGRFDRGAIAAALPSVLARRDLARFPGAIPAERGLSDRLAVIWSGLSGRIRVS